MSYTVTKLLTNAYYLSGIVSREFQTVSGTQLNDGLDILNDILADKTVDNGMIPYYTTDFNFNAIIGQEQYFIQNLIEIETMCFFIGTVRYSMSSSHRKKYFGDARANNVTSLPFNYHVESCFGGANVFLYFFPDQPYSMQCTGQFRLSSVSLGQDLTSNVTSANLGLPTYFGATPYTIGPGQLVVNGVDLAGTYASIIYLVLYVNSGIIQNVRANTVGNQFILYSTNPSNIQCTSQGSGGYTNNITFSNFSTTNGIQSQTFMPSGLDRFYIDYLKYHLAKRLCIEFNYDVPPGVVEQLDDYYQTINKRSSTLDLTMTKISTFEQNSTINYGQANLGKGWTV